MTNATPAARRKAKRHGIDINLMEDMIPHSGNKGQITLWDIDGIYLDFCGHIDFQHEQWNRQIIKNMTINQEATT